MKNSMGLFGFFTAALLLLSGCGMFDTFTVTKVKDVDFKKAYHTFAWMPDQDVAVNNAYDNEILRGEIHRAIERELLNRNLHPVMAGASADLQIQLLSQYTDRNQAPANVVPNLWWGRFGGVYNTGSSRFYKHNLLTVNMFDTRSDHRLVWTCTAEGDISSAKNILKNIPAAVEKIMKKYPVEPTAHHA